MKKIICPLIIFAVLFSFTACNSKTNDTVTFQAVILEIYDGYYLVEPVEGSTELNSADQITVPLKNMNPSPEPEVGDILEIEYDGDIAETYPAQITNVYSINVFDKEMTEEEGVLQSSEAANERVENFLDTFTQTYPDFNLLDYVIGSDKNKPIKLAAIAENKKSGSSSTLFIVDDNGTGQVDLASEFLSTYRKEDGITLNENVISISLDLNSSDTECEVHDFEITVTQKEKEGKPDTVYASKETIRK